MAHEVVKRVGARAYRYQVESYRDPASGKVRGRWTYLGRVDAGAAPRRRAPGAAGETRRRLLDALERLLERDDFARVSAGDVADEAGAAHGTFYRYFRNKRAALLALFEEAKQEIDRARPSFEAPLGSRDAERARVRAWVATVLASPLAKPGFLRAWYAAIASDAELGAARRERRAATSAALAGYLERLSAAGLANVPRPQALASVLPALFDGMFRAAVVDGIAIDDDAVSSACDLFERTIFA